VRKCRQAKRFATIVARPSGRLTQHKRFVPYSTHPNFCFAKTSFMLKTLGDISLGGYKYVKEVKIVGG